MEPGFVGWCPGTSTYTKDHEHYDPAFLEKCEEIANRKKKNKSKLMRKGNVTMKKLQREAQKIICYWGISKKPTSSFLQ